MPLCPSFPVSKIVVVVVVFEKALPFNRNETCCHLSKVLARRIGVRMRNVVPPGIDVEAGERS